MNYEGDILIHSTEDGGEINFNSGILEMTKGFESMIYLLLFGGNIGDDGTKATENKEWWGNKTEPNNPERKIHSRLQNLIHGIPATPANLKKLEQAIIQDLSLLTTEKIADKIETDLSIPRKNWLDIKIIVWKDEKKLYETSFEINWKGMVE
jgi:phage gp46-like protein